MSLQITHEGKHFQEYCNLLASNPFQRTYNSILLLGKEKEYILLSERYVHTKLVNFCFFVFPLTFILSVLQLDITRLEANAKT